jgi:hypothetical protein
MNSAEEKNDFVPLMDMASTSNNSNQNQKNKVIDINEISEQNNSETIDEEESKEKLNLDYNTNLLDVNNSGIIQIPNNYVDDPNKSYSSENQNENTFDESILKTITRDLTLIYYKLKYIILYFIYEFKG